MSRASWYRQNKHRKTGETTLSAAIFLIPNDEPVSRQELGTLEILHAGRGAHSAAFQGRTRTLGVADRGGATRQAGRD